MITLFENYKNEEIEKNKIIDFITNFIHFSDEEWIQLDVLEIEVSYDDDDSFIEVLSSEDLVYIYKDDDEFTRYNGDYVDLSISNLRKIQIQIKRKWSDGDLYIKSYKNIDIDDKKHYDKYLLVLDELDYDLMDYPKTYNDYLRYKKATEFNL